MPIFNYANKFPDFEPKPDEKPWWESVGDGLKNSISKPGGLFRYVQLNEEGLILNTDNIVNDLEYEAKRLTNSPDTNYAEITGKTEGSRSARVLDYVTSNPIMQTVVPGGIDLNTNMRSSTAQAAGNAIKAIEDFEKPFGPKDDGLTLEEEGALDGSIEEIYASSGKKPRSQMNDQELGIDDLKASFALNGYLSVLTGAIGGAAFGFARSIPALAKYPKLLRLLNSTNFAASQSKSSFLRRFAFAQFIDEVPSTFLDDNTGGSAVQLGALLASLNGNDELAQKIAEMDPVKPGMSRTEASQAAFLPNALTAGGFGLGLVGGGRLARSFKNYVSNPPTRARALRSQTARQSRQEARSTLENENIIQTDETGKSTFTEEAYQPPREGMTAEEQFREANGIPQEPTSDTTPTPPGLDEAPDPTLPEVDGLVETVDSTVSDEGLDLILEKSRTGSVVDAVNEVVQAERAEPVSGDLRPELTEAPVDSLVLKGDFADRYSSVKIAQLQALVRNSPELSAEITRLTGKTADQFNRQDILNGMKSRESRDGVAVMPSRLMGQPMMLTSEMEVNPQRFQFKQGTDAKTGEQKGNSLDGVEVWNENAEGTIQVWEDPMDGKTYVVNGHNRKLKAEKLGIPSLRVEYINAKDAAEARGIGALSNIAQGSGTLADAGKFFRDMGIVDEKQLLKEGLPINSGFATKGLALSRLPGNIFQDFVDGRISQTKAIAIGGSQLDEVGMQKTYKVMQDEKLTEDQINEFVQQAQLAPTVKGKQIDIFGNTETRNLMVEKAKIAAAVRAGLRTQKRAAKSAASNAATLEAVGNQINKEGSQTLADDTEGLIRKFDADKYMETDTSKMLNEAALEVADGASINTVAKRVQRELLELAETQPAQPRAVEPEVVVPAPQPRRKKLAQIAKAAAQKGEVRPPSTPLPETPDPGAVSTSKDPAKQFLETTENELRLGEDYAQIDDAVAADRLEAQRNSINYDLMTFEQKKQNGLLDGLTEDEVADRVRAGDTAEIEEAIGRKLVTEKTTVKGEERVVGEGVTRPIGNTNPERPWEQADVKPNLKPNPFKLPADVAKSKPRYGMAQLKFESDLDRAAYIIRNKAEESKGEARIVKALEEQGYDVAEIRKLGDEVKIRIGDRIKEATGTRRAPQKAMTIEVPASTRDSAPSLSRTGPQLSRSGEYDEAKIRKRLENRAQNKAYMEEVALMEIGLKLPDSVAGMTRLSKQLSAEMVDGLKDAARISGLDPLRIQYLDKIDTRKMFGEKHANSALEAWSPDMARFAEENPGDPLVDVADGGAGGVFVPRDFASIHRNMVYLAMGPNLNIRLRGGGINKAGGSPLPRTAYHEAFHAVQEWMELMSAKPKFDSLSAKSMDMEAALSSDEAIAEMTKLVKGDKYAAYREGMNLKELQAEAFATWYNNRKIKLKAGGLQAAFENIKKFINTLRRKWKIAFKKDPSYVDVFELAAEGKIADKGNAAIAKLRPEQLEALSRRIDRNMDQLLPGLTERVEGYLKQKQADFDLLNEQIRLEADVEGC